MPFAEISDASLDALVRHFYGAARQDAQLGPIFEAAVADWEEHFGKLVDFWSSVMLTTGRYKGTPMGAHARHPIGPEHFGRWLELWRESANATFEPDLAGRFKAKAEHIAESLMMGLAIARGGDPFGPVRSAHH
ncbi:MAG TPA: group III truncated hemoglobin [Magnetospirillaceae bacterium]|jgi:hemoglobin